jgi:hypothetical protein
MSSFRSHDLRQRRTAGEGGDPELPLINQAIGASSASPGCLIHFLSQAHADRLSSEVAPPTTVPYNFR